MRTGKKQFVLQRLQRSCPPEAVEDMRTVTSILLAQPSRSSAHSDLKTGRSLRTTLRWTMAGVSLHPRVFDAIESNEMALEAGRIVGEMHRHLRGLSFEPTREH